MADGAKIQTTISCICPRFEFRFPVRLYRWSCCCCLPYNHCSNWTWVVKEILAFGIRLRSTHCRDFNYLKLCRPAYFVRTTKSLPHPSHDIADICHLRDILFGNLGFVKKILKKYGAKSGTISKFSNRFYKWD